MKEDWLVDVTGGYTLYTINEDGSVNTKHFSYDFRKGVKRLPVKLRVSTRFFSCEGGEITDYDNFPDEKDLHECTLWLRKNKPPFDVSRLLKGRKKKYKYRCVET